MRSALAAGSGPGTGKRLLDYTHFISLPLASPAVVQRYEAFVQGVLTDPASAARGIEESVGGGPMHATHA